MLHVLLIFLSFTFQYGASSHENEKTEDLVSTLREDMNLDLSVDEEYEDLRAELLAYHTALASLTRKEEDAEEGALEEQPSGRRSLSHTPCWQLGGICVNYKLCKGLGPYLTQIYGCRDKNNVCCFKWNKYKVDDMRDLGISNLAFPWGIKQNYGGKGVIQMKDRTTKKPKLKSIFRSNNVTGTDILSLLI